VQVLEAQDSEECLTLVCEAAVPLSLWLSRHRPEAGSGAAAASDFVSSLTWGLHCLVTALLFLHGDAGVVHGAVNVDTVYVTPGGDWKLAGFDSAASTSGSDDFPPALWREVSWGGSGGGGEGGGAVIAAAMLTSALPAASWHTMDRVGTRESRSSSPGAVCGCLQPRLAIALAGACVTACVRACRRRRRP
jgi:hypothetical protein